MEKSVLVSYQERNKIIRIPNSLESEELSYLTKQFKKVFSFGNNVNLQVSFQKFDNEWKEYIELEKPAVICHKDKLQAIVTPLLVDNTPVSSSRASSEHFSESNSKDTDITESTICDSNDTSHIDLAISDDDDTDFQTPPPSKRLKPLESDSDCEDIVNKPRTSTRMPVIPSVIKREMKEEKPLPDRFPFPAHYRQDVEISLSTGNMSRETKAAFYSSIASAMFGFKKYPTGEEYTRIACEIIKQYPFLKPPKGSSPTASIKQSLINRFKEFRRLPKVRSPNTGDSKHSLAETKQKRKAPSINLMTGMTPPEIPPGEDQTSFKQHNKRLMLEYKKSNPNMAVVTTLMELTFAFRRADILDNSSDITSVLSKYPFLQNVDQLFLEIQRIVHLEKFQSSVRNSWIKIWSLRILSQTYVEKQKNKRLSKIVNDIPADENSSFLTSLIYLVYMLPESRVTPNHKHVIYAIPESCDIERAVADKGQSEPYVLVLGTYQEPLQAFLIVDSVITAEINCKDTVSVLLCSFFVFNVCYTRGCNNLYLFLDYALLNIVNKKLPPSITHFLASLNTQTLSSNT